MEEAFDGKVVGGWGFVWAGYAITWLTVVLYGLSLYWRERGGDTPTEPPPGEPT